MKKYLRLCLPVLALLCAVMLFGCESCDHEWEEASCRDPKTCALCGKIEGEELGHDYLAATCEDPETCSRCGKEKGEALGHTWADATCSAPKTCTVCKATEGEALAHTWTDATCTSAKTCTVCGGTEGAPLGHEWYAATCAAPKTCSVCGKTEGGTLAHSWVDATCENPKTCSVCGSTEGAALEHEWVASCTTPNTCTRCGKTEGEAKGHDWEPATTTAPKTCRVCGLTEGDKITVDDRFHVDICQELFGDWSASGSDTYEAADGAAYTMSYNSVMSFSNTGVCTIVDVFDLEEYRAYYQAFMTDYMYEYYADYGYSKAEADADMKAYYGMTIPEYMAALAAELTQEDAINTSNCVYYVEDGKLYISDAWDSEFTACPYVRNGDTLTISGIFDYDLVLTLVTE